MSVYIKYMTSHRHMYIYVCYIYVLDLTLAYWLKRTASARPGKNSIHLEKQHVQNVNYDHQFSSTTHYTHNRNKNYQRYKTRIKGTGSYKTSAIAISLPMAYSAIFRNKVLSKFCLFELMYTSAALEAQ
jgi:hypothetical protein